jgi:hypothetical protein
MVTPMNESRRQDAGEVALVDFAAVAGSGGVVWSISPQGFHTNLVVLDGHGAIGLHRNDVADVLVVVLAGDRTATVGEQRVPLAPVSALLIERGRPDRYLPARPGSDT